MYLRATSYPLSLLRFLAVCAVLLLGVVEKGYGQTPIYPSGVYTSANVNGQSNALNGTTSVATLKAHPGIALNAGKYNGKLGLRFDSTIPANKTSFIRIGAEDDGLLDVLLGGTVGNLLTGLVSGLLLGDHHFTVTAFNDGTQVVTGNSRNGFSISSGRIRLIRNAAGHYLLAITPNQSYNRLYIENQSDAAVGLLVPAKELEVYYAFHMSGTDPCGVPMGTSFDVSGVNLDLLELGGNPADNIHLAIDGDMATYSGISPGVLSLAGNLSQHFYFDGKGLPTDEVRATLSVPPGLLTVEALSNISFIAYNGSEEVYSTDLNALGTELLGLVQLDLLSLLTGGTPTTFAIHPGVPFDRVEIRANTLLGLGTSESLRIYEVVRTPDAPTVKDVIADNGLYMVVCEGDHVTLTATPSSINDNVRWYDEDGVLLNVDGMPSYTFGPVNTSNDGDIYYVTAIRAGCSEESMRIAFTLVVLPQPGKPHLTITNVHN